MILYAEHLPVLNIPPSLPPAQLCLVRSLAGMWRLTPLIYALSP